MNKIKLRQTWRIRLSNVRRYLLALPFIAIIMVMTPGAAYANTDDNSPGGIQFDGLSDIACLFGVPNIGFLGPALPVIRDLNAYILGAFIVTAGVVFLFNLFKYITEKKQVDNVSGAIDGMQRAGIGVILGISIPAIFFVIGIVLMVLRSMIICSS